MIINYSINYYIFYSLRKLYRSSSALSAIPINVSSHDSCIPIASYITSTHFAHASYEYHYLTLGMRAGVSRYRVWRTFFIALIRSQYAVTRRQYCIVRSQYTILVLITIIRIRSQYTSRFIVTSRIANISY